MKLAILKKDVKRCTCVWFALTRSQSRYAVNVYSRKYALRHPLGKMASMKTSINTLFANLSISYASSLIGFAIVLILARALGAEEYGWIAMGLAIGRVLSNIVELGGQRTFVRAAVRRKDESSVVLLATKSFGIRLTVFVVCLVVIAVFSAISTSSVATFLGLFFSSVWVLLLGLYPASWFDYTRDTKLQNIYIFIERLISLATCLILLMLPEYMLITLTAVFPLFCVRAIAILRQVRHWLDQNKRHTVARLKLNWPTRKPEGLSYYVAVAMLSNSILTYGNQVILGLTPYKLQLPSYSIAFQIVGLIMIFQGQALRIFLRSISDTCKRKVAVKRNLAKHAIFVAAVSAAMSIIVWALTRWLLPIILVDESFSSVQNFVSFLGVWVTLSGIGKVVSQYLLEFNLDSAYLVTSIIGGVSALFLGFVFIPAYGVYAVIAILLGAHSIMITANLAILIRRFSKLSIN